MVTITETKYKLPCECCGTNVTRLKNDSLYIVQFYNRGTMDGGKSLCEGCLRDLSNELQYFVDNKIACK